MSLSGLQKQISELRSDLVDRNWTLADLSELGDRELAGERVPPIPPWVEAGLKALIQGSTQAGVQRQASKTCGKTQKAQNKQAQRC